MVDVLFQSSSVYSLPFLGGAAKLPCTATPKGLSNCLLQQAISLSGSQSENAKSCMAGHLFSPATDDVRITRLTFEAFETLCNTFRVPLTAGSIRAFWGSSESMKNGDLQAAHLDSIWQAWVHACWWELKDRGCPHAV